MRMTALWCGVASLLLAGGARAQEAPVERPRTDGFFGERGRVSFWAEAPRRSGLPPGSGEAESLFGQAVHSPDGRASVWVPPRPVVNFLENPTLETGRAYLAWQKARLDRIARASEILTRLSGRRTEEGGEPGESASLLPLARLAEPPASAAPPPKGPPPLLDKAKGVEVLYFKRAGCPHCEHEDLELRAVLAERPTLRIRAIEPGDEAPLWKAYDVSVVPTILLRNSEGRTAIVRGFVPKERLLLALASLEGAPK